MRKELHFVIAGCALKSVQFSARKGSEVFLSLSSVAPEVILSDTYIMHIDKKWRQLNSISSINEHLIDPSGIYSPLELMERAIEMVTEHNFAFMIDWKQVRVPARFQLVDNGKSVESAALDPLLALVIGGGKATMRECESYYSLADCFAMADLMVAATVNDLLAREAAEQAAKRR